MARSLRTLVGSLCAALLIGSAFAQNASTLWQTSSAWEETTYTHSAFSKNNEVVVIRQQGSNFDVMGLDKYGQERWRYPYPGTNVSASALLTTTDDRVYVLVQSWNPTIIALSQDGAFLWQKELPYSGVPHALTDMRIFGDSLVMVGTGRTVLNGTGPRTLMWSVNRHTGVQNYLREYLIGGQPYNDGAQIRSGASFAYILARKSPNIASAILKIDPANGDVSGSYVVGAYKINDFQVDSVGGIYTGGTLNSLPELRRINGSGVGSFPLIYRRPWGGGKLILSGGAAYSIDGSVIRKTRASDGVKLWEHDHHPGLGAMDFTDLKADSYGVVNALALYFRSGGMWSIMTFEPTSGNVVGGFAVANYIGSQRAARGSTLSINSFGEILTAGYVEDTVDHSLLPFATAAKFGPPITAAEDTFNILEGSTLTANLLANDRYANPAYCHVYHLSGSGPAQGSVSITSAGVLTYIAPAAQGTQTFKYLITRDSYAVPVDVTINIRKGPKSFVVANGGGRVGPGNLAGTITMSSPGASTVTLTSDNPALVPLPPTIVVDGVRTFSIRAMDYVSVSTTVNLTASYNGISVPTTFTVHPAVPSGIYFDPIVVTGGQSTVMTLSLNGAAGPSPVVFNLSTTSPYATVPATATIPVGATKVLVPITTTTPPGVHMATIKCVSPIGTLERAFRINP